MLATCALVGCAGAKPEETTTPTEPAPVATTAAPSMTLDAFAGDYAIEGSTIADTCDAHIVLAAQHVRIDAASRTVFADVVERTYPARLEAGVLVAEGRFTPQHACPQSTIYETWRLTPTGGGLEGTLVSTWLIEPDCAHPCTLEVAIRARPMGG